MTTEEPKKRIIRKRKVVETKSQLKCNVKDCGNNECNHYIDHDKNSACDGLCVTHPEARCI